MILSPIAAEQLSATLRLFEVCLSPAPTPRAAWTRITGTLTAAQDMDEARLARWHAQAVDLADRFGMAPLMEDPATAFSWDGHHVRALSEPAVLVHEVAHYQLASPNRRTQPDFGLGAGPETGEIQIADAARCMPDMGRESEEQMASLLGILWEAELGQPGILAFQEQNWLEGAGRPSAAAFFEGVVMRLFARGLIDAEARPLMVLSILGDGERKRERSVG